MAAAPPPDPARQEWGCCSCLPILLTLAVGFAAGVALTLPVRLSRTDPRPEVTAVLAAQEAAWNAGDLDGFMAGYWNDERLTFSSGGTVTRGWQPTLDRFRQRYQADGKEMGTLAFSELEVEPLAADAALVRGQWALAFVNSAERPSGLFTLIVRKTADGWKVVHDHTSAADPPKKN